MEPVIKRKLVIFADLNNRQKEMIEYGGLSKREESKRKSNGITLHTPCVKIAGFPVSIISSSSSLVVDLPAVLSKTQNAVVNIQSKSNVYNNPV